MKKLIVSVLLIISSILMFSCEMPTPQAPNYNEDIQAVPPDSVDLEHFEPEENTDYYTSPGISLWASVNGAFLEIDYFSLDGNKRVYDNLYLYEKDYFYMLTDDMVDIYAALGDSNDTEYAEEERAEGYELQINIKKSGIYKLIFDVETLKFDLEYKSAIDTPRYYTIKDCDIYTTATSWLKMSENTQNMDEFFISSIHIDSGKDVSFFSHIHTSKYNPTLIEENEGKFGETKKDRIKVIIGGNYNIYINKNTYEARLELINPGSADYSCVYYDGEDFLELEPYEIEKPYIFVKQITVDKLDYIPKFHSASYSTYNLKALSNDWTFGTGKYAYFKEAGTYNITINLITFEITIEKAPE